MEEFFRRNQSNGERHAVVGPKIPNTLSKLSGKGARWRGAAVSAGCAGVSFATAAISYGSADPA
jgi:hypothetical protein